MKRKLCKIIGMLSLSICIFEMSSTTTASAGTEHILKGEIQNIETNAYDSEDYVMDKREIALTEKKLVTESINTTGNKPEVQNFAIARANGYSYGLPTDTSDFGCSIAGKKALFHLDVAFNWNGRYVYATDAHYWVAFLKKGLKIVSVKTEITKPANKSKVYAKFIKRITLKNIEKNRIKTFVMGYKCTPNGAMRRVAHLE